MTIPEDPYSPQYCLVRGCSRSPRIAIMVADPFRRRRAMRWRRSDGAGRSGAGRIVVLVLRGTVVGLSYSNLWTVDEFTVFFHVVFLFIIGMTILASMRFHHA